MSLLSSRTRALLFKELFGLSRAPRHIRDLARRTGLSSTAVRKELQSLRDLDLVVERRDGNRLYYAAREDHPLFPELHGLVLKTVGLCEAIAERLRGASVVTAFVFGSVSRGEERAASDVDLMVVGDVGLREVSRLLAGLEEVLGREVNAHVLSLDEYRQRLASGEHFLTRVLEGPKLFVTGSQHDLDAVGT